MKSGSKKFVNILSVFALIFTMGVGGIMIWDHHNYYIPNSLLSWFDPKGDPVPASSEGNFLVDIQTDLLLRKQAKAHERDLQKVIQIKNTKWNFESEFPDSNGDLFEATGTIIFEPNGKLKVTGDPMIKGIPNSEFHSYFRRNGESLELSSENESIQFHLTLFGRKRVTFEAASMDRNHTVFFYSGSPAPAE